jgi:hypothetical protein
LFDNLVPTDHTFCVPTRAEIVLPDLPQKRYQPNLIMQSLCLFPWDRRWPRKDDKQNLAAPVTIDFFTSQRYGSAPPGSNECNRDQNPESTSKNRVSIAVISINSRNSASHEIYPNDRGKEIWHKLLSRSCLENTILGYLSPE